LCYETEIHVSSGMMGHLAGMQNWVVHSNINKLAIPSLASVKLCMLSY